MSRRQSCIVAPPQSRLIEIRQEYIGLCSEADYPNCAAALLGLFEHWMNFKIEQREEAIEKRKQPITDALPSALPSYWVRMSIDQIKAELFGLFGESAIEKSLKWLVTVKRYIATRTNRREKRDRTLQYLFRVNVIQKALNQWARSDLAPSFVRRAAIACQYGVHSVPLRNAFRASTQALTQDSSLPSNEGKDAAPKKRRKKAQTSGEKKPVKRSDNFITIAREFFQVFDVDVLDETGVKRINILVGWLKKHSPGATVVTLLEFCKWYDKKFNKAARPRDVEKFAEHFAAFKTQHQNPGTAQASAAITEAARIRALKMADEKANNERIDALAQQHLQGHSA